MSNTTSLPPIKKNALDERKLALYGKQREGAKGAPKLIVSLTVNNPRLTVFTNDGNNTILRAKMDSTTFMALLLEISELPDRENGYHQTFINMTGPPSNMVEDSKVIVGKNNNGVCFVSVGKGEEHRELFPFLPSMYHKVYDNEGEVPPDKLSNRYATAWARLYMELVPNLLDSQYMESTYNSQNRGGGNYNQGGGNRHGGGGGGTSYGGSQGGGDTGGPSESSGFDDFDGMPM